ncbi:MAG: restriction endonuclease subunit S [Candidatus Kapabacteria bacterium]|nr:restriction endonuclease subunit S [Candidatus Kapabacteria bacterium]
MKNWGRKKIVDISTVFEDGDWIESKDQSTEGIRLIQTGNVGNGIFKDRGEKARYISEDTFKKLRCTEIFKGDCLVSRLPDPVGRACILPDTGEKMITAVDCTIIRFDQKQLISNWFLYYSLSNEYQNEIQKQVTGATRQRISRKNLGLVFVPLPPLPEQQRIVSILDEAFAAIAKAKANAEQNLKNAKELFESYLQGAFKKKGVGWEEKKFDEVCVLQRGFDLPTNSRFEGDYPLVSSNGITDRINEWKIKAPGVVTGRSGTIGNVHFIEEDFWPLNTALYIKEFHGNNERCIYYFLLQFDLGKYSSGAGVPTLNRNNVHSVKIWFPKSIEEQKTIVRHLDELRAETQKLEAVYQKKIDDLEELKKSILQKAFAGELKTEKVVAV